MKWAIFIISLIGLIVINSFSKHDYFPKLSGTYFGQSPPGDTPVRFGSPVFDGSSDRNWHGKLGFSPDGNRFFMEMYTKDSTYHFQLFEMVQQNGLWSAPNRPAFANNYNNASPVYFNNDSSILFISDRPDGGCYGLNIVSHTKSGWSAPSPFVFPCDPTLGGGWEVSVARSGNIYLRLEDMNSSSDGDIYIIRKENGHYLSPENLGPNINSSSEEHGPFIDPDEEYLLFTSKRSGGKGNFDLYVSFRNFDGTWGLAKNIGSGINTNREEMCPYVSPDKKYLFFNRHRKGIRNPYWVDAKIIDELKLKTLNNKSSNRK